MGFLISAPWWFCNGWWSPWCFIDVWGHKLGLLPDGDHWICRKHDRMIK